MSMKVQQAKRAAEAGFTLIELMIVIAIIGILAAIAIPQYEQYIVTSKATTIAQDFHQAITQGTAAVAAASAGQHTTLPKYANLPGGYALTVTSGNSATAAGTSTIVGGTYSNVAVVLNGGSSNSLGTAVASALSGMNMAGSGSAGTATTSSVCTAVGCTVYIDSNGGINFTVPQ